MGGMHVHATVEIDASPETVFEELIRFDLMPRWQRDLVHMNRLDDGPLAPGARFEQVRRFGYRDHTSEAVIEAIEPPKLLSVRSTGESINADGGYTIEGSGGHSKMTLDFRISAHGFLGLIMKLFKGSANRTAEEDLLSFKDLVEGRVRG